MCGDSNMLRAVSVVVMLAAGSWWLLELIVVPVGLQVA
jgi:hypothetical protein